MFGNPSDEREFSEKLHLQSYLEIYGLKRDILDYRRTIIFCLLTYYILLKDKGLYVQNNGYRNILLE